MKEFLTQHIDLVLAVIGLCVFAFFFVRTLKKAKKIYREGLVASAVVSRVELDRDVDTASDSYLTYVRFTDRDGVQREAAMARTPKAEYAVGQELHIKYLPGEYKMVREYKG